jgi:hypothetical protein
MILEILIYLKSLLSPLLVPLCFLSAWTILFLMASNLFFVLKDLAKNTQLMHRIPCSSCQFFVNDPRLKCTVRPQIANTEEAIDCYDYQKYK